MDYLCETCLSSGRYLYSIDLKNEFISRVFSAIGQVKLSGWSGKLICWECRAVMKKIQKFFDKAKMADNYLKHNLAKNQAGQKVSLSKLISQTKGGCDYEFYHSEVGNTIKIEFQEYETSDMTQKTDGFIDMNEGDITVNSIENLTILKNEVSNEEYENNDSLNEVSLENILNEYEDIKPQEKPKRSEAKSIQSKGNRLAKYTQEERKQKYDVILMSEEEMIEYREKDKIKPFYVQAPFKCETCISGFYNQENYDNHVKQHHSEIAGRVSCPICKCLFPSLLKMRKHKRARHYRLLACKRCPYRDPDSCKMLRHCENEHDIDKIFPCGECDEVFTLYYQLKYHREHKHQRSICPQCGKSVSTRWNLTKHMKVHEPPPSIECDICHKKLRSREYLKHHLRTHEQATDDPEAYCAECNKQFKNKYIYRSHLKHNAKHRNHESLKHQCTQCSKKFTVKAQLRIHYEYMHLKKTKWHCDACEKYFTCRGHLIRHIRVVHEKVKDEKKHACNMCNKKFAAKQKLVTHIRTHTGERPYKCAVCDATFAQHAALWTHNKLVHLKLKKKDKVRAARE